MHKKFKPEYKTSRTILYVLVIVMTIAFGTMGTAIIYIGAPIWIWGAGIGMTACWPLLFYWRIKREPNEIVFDEMIELNFGIWGQKRIHYSDVNQFGIKTIRGNNFVIAIAEMVNFEELAKIFEELINDGRIDQNTLKPDALIKETADLKTAILVFPISFIVTFLLIFFGFMPENFPPKLFGLIVFLCCYFAIYSIWKNRISNLTRPDGLEKRREKQ